MTFPWMVNFFNPPTDLLRLSFDRVTSTNVYFDFLNNTATKLVIASIWLDWPPDADAIFFGLNAGTVIANFGGDGTPPSFIDSGWANTVDDRTWFPHQSDEMQFTTGTPPSSTGWELIVTFTNGWEISTSN